MGLRGRGAKGGGDRAGAVDGRLRKDDGAELEPLPVESPFAPPGHGHGHGHGDASSRTAAELSSPLHHPHGQRPSVGYRAAVLGTIVLFIAATGALLVLPGHESPTLALARVRAFVKDQRTAHFVDDEVDTFGSVGGGLGDTSTTRSRSTGDIRLPRDSRVVTDYGTGEGVSEVLTVDGAIYVRNADSTIALGSTLWVKETISGGFGPANMTANDRGSGGMQTFSPTGSEPPVPVGRGIPQEALLAMAQASVMGGGMGPLFNFQGLLEKAQQVETLDHNRLRATAALADLVPEELHKALGADLLSTTGGVTLTIQYGAGGRLDGLVIEALADFDGDQTTDRHDIHFSNWGGPVAVAPPAPGQVDATPGIDEGELAAITDMTVLAPRSLPPGYVLESMDVTHRSVEDEECESVTLEYVRIDWSKVKELTESGGEPPTITVTSVGPNCPYVSDNEPALAGARTVRVGDRTGKLVDNVEDNTYSYLSDGVTLVFDEGTHVLASTNDGEALLLQVMATLGPLDLATQPAAQVPWPFGMHGNDFGD
jgi:hypothetical protein